MFFLSSFLRYTFSFHGPWCILSCCHTTMYMFILICCAHVWDGKMLLTSFIRIMWLLAGMWCWYLSGWHILAFQFLDELIVLLTLIELNSWDGHILLELAGQDMWHDFSCVLLQLDSKLCQKHKLPEVVIGVLASVGKATLVLELGVSCRCLVTQMPACPTSCSSGKPSCGPAKPLSSSMLRRDVDIRYVCLATRWKF